ncbi:hypothetical protein DM01DRAFT_149029 [Hesseltinella vesiculosa]|uniref:Rad1-domain-containing protein n=1 Tax=Hesseltinella vesiculosa TaxID=101127 RepID=A0A1X2G2E6_9FUNG|nr:hypothetical protein DM01DRAFT_149029 [Hesseltinella vesiculosa]
MVDEEPVEAFSGTVKSVKLLIGLVKSIQFKQNATVHFHEEGMTLTVMIHHLMKAVVFVKRLVFEQYRRQADDIAPFDINLPTFLECLTMMGPTVGLMDTCRIAYQGPGYPLRLMREDREAHLSIQCNITPLESDPEGIELMVNDLDTVQRVIIKAQWLQDAFGDLDSECNRVNMVFSTSDPCLILYGDGANGVTSNTEYQAGSEAFVGFECHEPGTYSYQYTHINSCLKALEQASEVSLRINTEGVLCILIRLRGTDDAYLEYTILPCQSTGA